MKKLLPLFLLILTVSLHAQIQKGKITKEQFEKAKIHVKSTEVVFDSVGTDRTAFLKIRYLDYNKKTIDDYYAVLDPNKKEYVSHSTTFTCFSAMRQFSIVTVPFKVRARNSDGYVTAKADVDNIGLFIPFYLKDIERYWLDNTSRHKISFGVLLAPMAEELNDKNTQNYFNDPDKSYKAFMFSTAIAATYTYKKITIALIPAGFDFGTDAAGKNWVNHGKYWFGFGLGVDTELFGF